ncbi:MAG: hypothetical protein NZ700_00850 [Gemmataceae bacterium]|nr:hypothetical protein [Gemmataceae bacterium]MDW8266377.1 hypothetical protein [Gemmataceae bacterium]
MVGLLQLVVVAMLSRCATLAPIADCGRSRGKALSHALGFRNGQMPRANSLANLFRPLNPDRLEAILRPEH